MTSWLHFCASEYVFNDFVTKYIEVVAEIYNSEFTDEKKSQFMDELRTKNMTTISNLNEILQSEMEIQMGEFNVSGKDTNDETTSSSV